MLLASGDQGAMAVGVEKGSATFSLTPKKGGSIKMEASERTTAVFLHDSTGQFRASMALEPEGNAIVEFWDSQGKSVEKLP